MPFYGQDVWDPLLIVAQMGMMQALFYVSAGVTLTANSLVGGTGISLASFFDARTVTLSTAPGAGVSISWLLVGFASSLSLMLVVERTQKCWDFGLTVYVLHVAACTLYEEFPTSWHWWTVHAVSCAAMILLGERLCLANESREISVDGFLRSIRDHARGAHRAPDAATAVPDGGDGSDADSLPPASPLKGRGTFALEVGDHIEPAGHLMRATSTQRRREDSTDPDAATAAADVDAHP